jgi:hypothetical protein
MPDEEGRYQLRIWRDGTQVSTETFSSFEEADDRLQELDRLHIVQSAEYRVQAFKEGKFLGEVTNR